MLTPELTKAEPFVFSRELWTLTKNQLLADERNYRTDCEHAEKFGRPHPPRRVRSRSVIPPWALEPLRLEEADGFHFIQEEPPPAVPLDRKTALQIVAHPELCPACKGTGSMRIRARGSVTGIQVLALSKCPCLLDRIFYGFWHNPTKVDQQLYRDVRPENLNDLRSRFRGFKGQVNDAAFAQLLELVQKPRLTSMLMCGYSDTGKTTVLMAIYARIVREWALKEFDAPQVTYFWRVSATKLAQEFRAWELRDPHNETDHTPAPTVTIEKVNFALKAGHRPYLLIEELDKYKLDSDFQNNLFLQVVDQIYAAGGAIFTTSNLSYENLRYRMGEQYGPALMRRIVGPPEGCLVNFSAGTVHPGYRPELETDGLEGQRTRPYTPTTVTPARAAIKAWG